MRFHHILNTYTTFTFPSQFHRLSLPLPRICWLFLLLFRKEIKWQTSKTTSAMIWTIQDLTSPMSSELSAMIHLNGRMLFRPTKEGLFPYLLTKDGQLSLPLLTMEIPIQLPAIFLDLHIHIGRGQQTAWTNNTLLIGIELILFWMVLSPQLISVLFFQLYSQVLTLCSLKLWSEFTMLTLALSVTVIYSLNLFLLILLTEVQQAF